MREPTDYVRLPAGAQAVGEDRWGEEARMEERQKIARDLHDTVIQPLAALVTHLACLQPPPTNRLSTSSRPGGP